MDKRAELVIHKWWNGSGKKCEKIFNLSNYLRTANQNNIEMQFYSQETGVSLLPANVSKDIGRWELS